MSGGRVLGAVFARGGSKGVPGKNLWRLGGKPLLEHSLDALAGTPGIWRIVVSTDHGDIAAAARSWGAQVIDRPPELARDDSPEWLSWQHVVAVVGDGWGERPDDILLSAPTTSPLRAPGDLSRAIERLASPEVDVVISVTPAHANPYRTMVKLDPSGYASLLASLPTPVFRRQDAPPVFDITGVVFAARATFISSASQIFDGRVAAIEVLPGNALDIDTELDLVVAVALWNRRAGQGREGNCERPGM
jgi:CMP-N-acetylneuraminic acid synthetase